MTAAWEEAGVEGLSKKDKGLTDVRYRVVIAGGGVLRKGTKR